MISSKDSDRMRNWRLSKYVYKDEEPEDRRNG